MRRVIEELPPCLESLVHGSNVKPNETEIEAVESETWRITTAGKHRDKVVFGSFWIRAVEGQLLLFQRRLHRQMNPVQHLLTSFWCHQNVEFSHRALELHIRHKEIV